MRPLYCPPTERLLTLALLLTSSIALAPFGSSQAAPPTFDSYCDADPSTAFITASLGVLGSRSLYTYNAAPTGSGSSLAQIGQVSAPINAIGFYEGYLYGIGRDSGQLFQVAGDASIADSFVVSGLPTSNGRAYTSGTTDKETGTHYVFARGYRKAFAIDLTRSGSVPTATSIRFLQGGSGIDLDFGDFAFSNGKLYGYDDDLDRGFAIDVATGETELFPIADLGQPGGLTDQIYPAAWISPQGTLFLYKTSDEAYEVDISGPTWTTLRTLTGAAAQRAQRDGATCPVRFQPGPTFGCSSNPEAAFVTGSRSRLGSRALYEYRPDAAAGTAVLDSLGEIEAPLNAFGLYADTLYGFHRTDGRLFKVTADAALVDSVVVPGLPVDRGRSYIAGTVDPDTGNLYVFARFFRKAYVIDLNDIGAGATKMPFTQNVGPVTDPVLLDFTDFAYSNGFLYGYDPVRASGFRIDATPGPSFGNVEFYSVENTVPTQLYPGAWFSPRRTLFLYKSAAETYELDVSDTTASGGWELLDQYGGLSALRAQRDAASCGPVALDGAFTAPSERTTRPELGMQMLGVPAEVTLGAIFPNPVRGQATVRFGLPEAGHARIAVYDIVGRQVGTPFDAEAEAGWSEAALGLDGLAAGTYVVRLQTASGLAVNKITVLD